MENNHKRQNSGNSRKDKKKYYKPASHHKAIIDKKGLLVFCERSQVNRSYKEVRNLCDEYVEKLYPELRSEKTQGVEENSNIDDEFKKELESLKNKKSNKNLFEFIDPGIGTMFFIAFTHPELDPIKITKAILTDLERDKYFKTKWTEKIYPIQKTCITKEQDMEKCLKELLDPVFNKPGDLEEKKYAILARSRFNTEFESTKRLTNFVIPHIIRKPNNIVSLKHPDWVVILEIMQTTCCLCVTNEYTRFKKFNVKMMVKNTKNNNEQKSSDSESEDSEPTKEDSKEEIVPSKEDSKEEIVPEKVDAALVIQEDTKSNG